MYKIAIIVGGSVDVVLDTAKACGMCQELKLPFEIFVLNDMIACYPNNADYGVTLHPDKLAGWLSQRRMRKFVELKQIWAHRPAVGVTKATGDWGGSSGLFACKIAIETGYQKILLCGIPMQPEKNHFLRDGKRWDAAFAFRRAWSARQSAINQFVRSCSGGWTQELLGPASAAFLTEIPQVWKAG